MDGLYIYIMYVMSRDPYTGRDHVNTVSYLMKTEALRLLKSANTVLILINPSPSNVKVKIGQM